ncbi:MAG: type II toxin-antitoxin system VapC family toxin [SAR324 cluster bacterium]|nr:type II toxin-antitoxin system VapC family toxin [SAR324 cluster bacterium]
MKSLYIESSAILTWLFGEPKSSLVTKLINKSPVVVSSTLSILETKRSILHAENQQLITAGDSNRLLGLFSNTILDWSFLEITEEVRNRAALPFPVEPVRSLDAVHLASILEFLILYPDISVLSFDQRIIDNLARLGLEESQ